MRNSSVTVADPAASQFVPWWGTRKANGGGHNQRLHQQKETKAEYERDAISTESTELSLVSSQKKNRGFLPESGEMSCRQKFMQITKFGRDSFATVVGFMMQIGKNILQPNNPFLIDEGKEKNGN